MTEFLFGFTATSQLLLRICGGAVAVLLLIVAILLILVTAARGFDLITTSLAERWRRKGRNPRNRLGKIILESNKRERGTPG